MDNLNRFRPGSYLVHGLVLCTTVLASGCDGRLQRVRVEETRVLEFMVADIGRVAAFADNGYIRVRPSATADAIRVVATIVAAGRDQEDAEKALAAVEILTPRTGDNEATQEIRWAWNGRHPMHWSASVSFDIEIPAALELAATTDNGEIESLGITGNRQLETDNGRIRSSDWVDDDPLPAGGQFAATDATVVARADNGEIDIESAAGSLVLRTDNGPIRTRSSARNVKIETDNGAVQARLTASGRLDGRIRTNNGSVEVLLNPEISTRIDCRTDSGSVRDRALPLREGSVQRPLDRQLKGVMGAGEGLLEIETDNGSITLEGMPAAPTINR
ncbi:MAG: DUF4097 family beta strand repeat protein [Planctomycetaceae bacterium]|nr:DUF4097 family beta strand repeat protein [Planctomycetaceae bacterium]